jgi:hypothetical protein
VNVLNTENQSAAVVALLNSKPGKDHTVEYWNQIVDTVLNSLPVYECQPINPFVVEMIAASMTETGAITNKVLDNYRNQLETAKATIRAIRVRVIELLSGSPYMPQPYVITGMLWSDEDTVNKFCEQPKE